MSRSRAFDGSRFRECGACWWRALMRPATAGSVVHDRDCPDGFTAFLFAAVFLLYAAYGIVMGLFQGVLPALASGLKLPCVFLVSLGVCYPAFRVASAVAGARLSRAAGLRLLLLALSADALAVCSYAPIGLFFTLTTSSSGYLFLVLMHVCVFLAAGVAGLTVTVIACRAAMPGSVNGAGSVAALAAWGCLFMAVTTHLAWVFRPWVAHPGSPYTLFRGIEGSFLGALGTMVSRALGG